MNLMFRKNFREQKSGVASKTSKACANRHASKRASREQGYTPMEEHHYRTHLFFNPSRCSYAQAAEDMDGTATGNKVKEKAVCFYQRSDRAALPVL
ncbi:hypothetical protein TcasGA2_TC001252 [Tribolium castaneum]|uniref:Uncharacterized protein n=1 Tax=Tribolium castaneum TaxID=7070 RepID=A0A139WMY4_TRICA|nr:hypothetical protein TcasGA2_TC001252 [Tribolium castaneum]